MSVQPHLEYGGSERQAVILANELHARGIDTAVIAFEARGGLVGGLNSGIELHDLGLESHLLLPEVARRLYNLLKTMPPSFVILKLWSALMAGSMIEHRLPQHKFVYTEDLDPRDHAEFIRLGALKQRVVRSIFRNRSRITANTFAVRDAMLDVYGLNTTPRVISSAVDISVLDDVDDHADATPQAQFLLNSKVPTIASVGSLGHRKGLDITLQALEKLETPVRWLILGEGVLLHEIQEWGTSNVEIMATGGNPRPFDIVRHADLVIHSARSEAFGIVLLEALGVGVPVISSATIGGSEIAHRLGPDPRMLATYPVGDVEALSELIRESLDRPVRPSIREYRQYVEPYSLKYTTDAWVSYAAEVMG